MKVPFKIAQLLCAVSPADKPKLARTSSKRKMEEEDEEEDEEEKSREEAERKFGPGGINRPVLKPQNRWWYSFCPLHIAVDKNHIVGEFLP